MALTPMLTVVVAVSAAAPIEYGSLRYTGFGVADPVRDKRIVDDFRRMLRTEGMSRLGPPQPMTPAARDARIAELEGQLKDPPGSSRAEQLRRKTRESELARLKLERASPPSSATPKAEPTAEQTVVALVDTFPEGVQLKDGHISSDSSIEILGHVAAKTASPEYQTKLVHELKVLAMAAGGNVVVLSYIHGGEDQGECHGAAALILRAKHFDPSRAFRGKLPLEI